MIILFLKGCLIGFSIAMPVGPIGLLCIRNALTRGMRFGLMTGLGAASADAIFGALAGLGVTAIGAFMTDFQMYLHMVGALFLAYLGIATFKEKPLNVEIANQNGGLSYAFISTFFLTLINPMTILSFAGIYAALSFGFSSADWGVPILMTVGIFVGSAIWWLLLSIAASHMKEKMNVKARTWLNRISGMIILGFGAGSVLKMLSV